MPELDEDDPHVFKARGTGFAAPAVAGMILRELQVEDENHE